MVITTHAQYISTTGILQDIMFRHFTATLERVNSSLQPGVNSMSSIFFAVEVVTVVNVSAEAPVCDTSQSGTSIFAMREPDNSLLKNA
jgi:hypothetical protein